MRYRIKAIILVFIIIACSKENKDLTINLNISNYSKDYLIIIEDTLGYGLSYYVDTIKSYNNGNFRVKIKPLKSNALIILKDSTKIQLTIPNSLNSKTDVSLDMLKPDSIQIYGKQALFLRYYQDQQKYWEKIYYMNAKRYSELISRDIQSSIYHAIQDTITDLRMHFLHDYFKNTNIENQTDFIAEEYNSLLYSNLYYRMSGQGADIIKSLGIYHQINDDTEILTYSDKIDFSNKKLLSISSYRNFVNDFIMNAVRLEYPKGDHSSYEFYLHNGLNVIDKWFKEPQINTLQKIVFIDYLLETAKIFKGNVDTYEYKMTIENLSKNESAKTYCDVLYHKLMELNKSIVKLSPGVNAPDFEIQDKHGKIYKLSDFRNQILIIDVWASWCGSCISSFPEWNSLNDKYSGKDYFHFVSVCTDDNPDKWQISLRKYKPKGQQLYVGPKGFHSQFH